VVVVETAAVVETVVVVETAAVAADTNYLVQI
jgi:hypothetical protein